MITDSGDRRLTTARGRGAGCAVGDGRSREARRRRPRRAPAFVVELGAAMNAAGEPVYVVQDRLTRMAAAYRAPAATVSAFPRT